VTKLNKFLLKTKYRTIFGALKGWFYAYSEKELGTRGKYFSSKSSWFPLDLKVVPYF
jgi:hypothetical protein